MVTRLRQIVIEEESFSIIENKDTIAEWVMRYGGSASVALLDPACHIFKSDTVHGVIGYKTAPGCAVVFGDPLCAKEDRFELVKEFLAFSKEHRRHVVFVTTSPDFMSWMCETNGCSVMEVEEELVINPQKDPTLGSEQHQLRKKLNRAKDAKVEILEYLTYDLKLENQIEEAAAAWLNNRQGMQIYMSKIDLFQDKMGKRWFYAKQNDEVVGVLLLQKLDAREGFLIHMVMIKPHAPQGTSESLVVQALKALREEGCKFATFGATPREEIGRIIHLGSLTCWIIRNFFSLIKKFFQLDNRREYWKKYKPESSGCYILFAQNQIGPKEILGIMRAFNVSI